MKSRFSALGKKMESIGEKIESMNKKQKIKYTFLSIALALLLLTQVNSNVLAPKASKIASVSRLGSELALTDNIERFNVPNSKKTVVYVPQIHKEPTSNVADPKNDKAAKVQKEISGILSDLNNNQGIEYIMDETDLYGPMPSDKIGKIKNGLNKSEQSRKNVKALTAHYVKDGGSKDVADQLEKAADASISRSERNIYLSGGAAVLAATDSDAKVFGSQNAATLNEARVQLQNIVFMEKRISELEGKNKSGKNVVSTKNRGESDQLKQILNSFGSSKTSGKVNLGPVSEFADANNDAEMLEQIKQVQKDLNSNPSQSYETTNASAVQKAGISTNPYANETNLPKLKSEYKKAYDKFMLLAKDQRSQEVVDNMDRMMTENNVDQAALVFGAQHKDQLVEMFNKKGISVIVITPESVSENPAYS